MRSWTPKAGAAIAGAMNETASSSDSPEGRAPHRRHDKLFRAVFSDPVHAQALVRDQLPNEIAGLLADKPPVVHPGSFIDEDLRESQADLLLEVELVGGGSAFVYVLIEHKSYPDAEVVLQVLGYMVRIWRDYVRQGKGRDGRAARLKALPPIIPLLGYSGSAPWTGPTDLGEMIAADNPALVCLDGPRLILRQWAQMGPDELSSEPVPQASLLTLTERAMAHVETLRDALVGNPVLQSQFVEYIMGDEDELDAEDLRERFRTAGAGEMEGVVATIAEKLEAKGEARGIAKGEVIGMIRGRQQDLIRLLERRFGSLSDADRVRIAEADLP